MPRSSTADHRSVIKFLLPLILGTYSAIGGAVVVLGYGSSIPRLYDWFANGSFIGFNPGLCFLLAGLGVLVALLWPAAKPLIYGLGFLPALVAAITFIENLFQVDLRIDALLMQPAPGSTGRMGLPTSLALTLLGTSLVLSSLSDRPRRWASNMATASLLIAALSLVGFIFGANQLYALPRSTGITLQSATMVAALATAIMALVHEHGIVGAMTRRDAGGVMLRKLIVPLIIICLVLGWLSALGQTAGLYDVAFGTAAGTLIEIVILLVLLWWTARDISRSETIAREAAVAVADRDERMHGVLESLSDAFVSFDPEFRITYANAALLQMLGQHGIDDAAIFGKKAADVIPDFRETSLGRALVTAMETREPIDLEDNFAPFGRWFHARYLPTRDGGVSLFALDITEQKISEQLLKRRATELGVLYEFADQLNRSLSTEEVYECALDTIVKAVACDRASILLFDDDGVMQFVAARGLSEEYKTAVTGHSPWKQGEKGARPTGISDIANADLQEDLRSVITAEGIGALGFIPLIMNDVLIGKFMIYFDEPHEFTPGEFEIALTVGYQIAIGVERTRTAETMQENEERLRIATDTGKVGVWDWDIRKNRVSWTESVYQMHGVSRDEFKGDVESFAALIHPDDREEVNRRIKEALDGGPAYEVEFRVPKRDGSVNWLFTNAVVIRDENGPCRMIGATIDVTERKLAERELAKAAAIVNSSFDAIVSKDLNGIIQSWNPGAELVFGYSADEIIGKPVTILIPEERQHEEARILATVHSGKPITHYETVRRRRDGKLIDISLSVSPVRDANGRIVGASKIARDITEARRAELAVREREMMSRLVDAQEGERHRIARDLHDHLGQQLTALRLKLESLKAKVAGDPGLTEDVAMTQEYATRIDLDVNYLAWELRPTELDHLGLTDALRSFVREWSKTYGIAADFHASRDKNARYDPELETNLYRIVQEGLNNILKHAGANSVSVLLEQRDDLLVLIIEDDGIGFDPDARKRNGSSGSGLGLIGMRERTALLGGTLEIESRTGEGTTVYARVPLKQAENNGKPVETLLSE